MKTASNRVLVIAGLICLQTKGLAEVDWDQWYSERTRDFEAALLLPEQERIPIFGQMTRVASKDSAAKLTGLRLESYRRAQLALLAIPGHAEYYEKNIKAAQQRYDKAVGPNERGPAAGNLHNSLTYGFRTLAQLPSPETVRVLGDFLSDHKGVDEDGNVVPGYIKGTGPACTAAANALMKLPLKNKPMPHKSYLRFEDVRPWQLWYQQIKAGTRTFSFEGDPQEYNLAGPVGGPRSPNTPRESRRSTDAKSANAAAPTPSSTPWIAGAIAVLLGVGSWLYLRKTGK